MDRLKLAFHYVSYLQYVFMLIAIAQFVLLFAQFASLLDEPELYWDALLSVYSNFLFYFGIALSFSTLQDTSKTQNSFSRKIWESPKKGKIALILMVITTAVSIIVGLALVGFQAEGGVLKEFGIGLTVFGIGYIGVVKTAGEMYLHHRKVSE